MNTTMSSQIEALPYEIRQFVLEYLDATHPSSLTALGCASKHLFAAVKPFLFRTIKFSVKGIRDSEDLKPDRISTAVQEYSKLLQRYNGVEHVQHLIIGGDITLGECDSRGSSSESDDDDDDEPYHWSRSKISHIDRLALASADGQLCDEEHVFGSSKAKFGYPQDCHNDDHAWKLLAEFRKTLSSLKHLIYCYYKQFPPCLLEALHDHHLGCKLHLYTFKIFGTPDKLDDYGTKLLKSPCLHSIKSASQGVTRCMGRRTIDDEKRIYLDHPGDFAMRHAVVIAPALKRIQVDILNRRGAIRTRYDRISPVTVAAHKDTLKSLHPLRIFNDNTGTVNRYVLNLWTANVDFAELKFLGVTMHTAKALKYL
ncbi:uncharacterized protein KD926_004546 [Aspergillus affinis]|uniref:uncharacterized protein n=1 Tax=Aspergillus affinis TaxID=1070780 RepID=UPI0022FDD04D|nr:uncharacterized protein KD926_004546 [Aspergillus affinis]KAI9043043.1 hypothetical protein KD926_004546 [Aspergillus affinis]